MRKTSSLAKPIRIMGVSLRVLVGKQMAHLFDGAWSQELMTNMIKISS